MRHFVAVLLGLVQCEECPTIGKLYREALNDKCSEINFDELLKVKNMVDSKPNF